MKKAIFFLATVALFATTQAQTLGRSSFEQQGDVVLVHYYMSNVEQGQTFDVSLACSQNGGKSYTITPQTTSGAIGKNIALNNGKNTITWQVRSDRTTLDGNNFKFKILDSTNKCNFREF